MCAHCPIMVTFWAFTDYYCKLLTHCGRVTQICVYTLQLCKTGDANLRFLTLLVSTHKTLNYTIHGACLRMVLLTDVYRNVTSLRINDL